MEQVDKLFQYKFINESHINVNHTLSIPFCSSLEELTHILLLKYNIPIYASKELVKNLDRFVKSSNLQFYDDRTSELVAEFKNQPNIEDITKEWERLIREETAEYGERKCASDEELFATAYHKLVHSPMLETMLQLEYMYAVTVRQRVNEKDYQIKSLSEKQTEEMNNAIDRLEKGMTESEINKLATKHFEDQTFLQVQLTSELETIKEAQRREYREWLMQMLEQNQANSSLPTPKSSPLSPGLPSFVSDVFKTDRKELQSTVLEESFTIHLGSQLKQMHNIRILSADVMDLCAIKDNEQLGETTPQLLQTALGLYSNDLCGLVLMTDTVIGSRLTKEFTEICERSTEFHFPYIEDQLESISNTLQKHQMEPNSARNTNSKHLQPGDVYVTRHSNLAQVHIIFHMVSDDSLRGSDINSRHPVVLGLRNILKTACSNDVTSLTIPLLLQYEMSEEMTVTWCAKRAELVFKCVKGFMIEMASWGGSDLKNLQFLLPQGISSDVFQSLTTMLPSIFKVSNPLILKTSAHIK
ncbi:hypothetical protein RN001_015628 [Aquatica leii]|uniref:Uncharacterized protein n=1 Tax=Aquatica leii TaxID=1421715 RepID=A0AAN7PM87_9COLE|nr:hypothetical protein RN001_015628 [Aquatica leii]